MRPLASSEGSLNPCGCQPCNVTKAAERAYLCWGEGCGAARAAPFPLWAPFLPAWAVCLLPGLTDFLCVKKGSKAFWSQKLKRKWEWCALSRYRKWERAAGQARSFSKYSNTTLYSNRLQRRGLASNQMRMFSVRGAVGGAKAWAALCFSRSRGGRRAGGCSSAPAPHSPPGSDSHPRWLPRLAWIPSEAERCPWQPFVIDEHGMKFS